MTNAKKKLTVVLCAGGTGGHVFPAVATAQELRLRGHEPILFCDKRALRFHELKAFPHYVIPSAPLSKNPIHITKIICGIMNSAYKLHRMAPDVVVGYGGYPTFPTVYAAGAMNIPTMIHEQNALLGRVNAFAARKAKVLASTYPAMQGVPSNATNKIKVVGNPVRQDILAAASVAYPECTEAGPYRLLIIGGSQGARFLSDKIPDALVLLPEEIRKKLDVHQQCRAEDVARVQALYEKHHLKATIAPFFVNIHELLAKAHLVISRAGASSLAELMVVGRPAILIPFKFAKDDHQTTNAEALVKAGGGWLYPEDNLTAQGLAEKITTLFEHQEMLKDAAAEAKLLGNIQAAALLSDLIESCQCNG